MSGALVPVRLTGKALHIATRTGRGYRTSCGRTLAGADVEVPPEWVRGRFGRRVDGWARAWRLELVCVTCDTWCRRHP